MTDDLKPWRRSQEALKRELAARGVPYPKPARWTLSEADELKRFLNRGSGEAAADSTMLAAADAIGSLQFDAIERDAELSALRARHDEAVKEAQILRTALKGLKEQYRALEREAARLATVEQERDAARMEWGMLRKWLKDEIAVWQVHPRQAERDRAVARLNNVLHEMTMLHSGQRKREIDVLERDAALGATVRGMRQDIVDAEENIMRTGTRWLLENLLAAIDTPATGA